MEVQFESGELEGSKYLGEGTYACLISKLEHKNSKKGDPMIEVEFLAQNGKTTRDWFMLAGNKFKLASLALAAGFKKEDLVAKKFRTESLANRTVKVVRELKGKETYVNRENETKERNVYENSYLPTEGNAATAASDDELPF